jgi:hypothetical protein
LRGALPAIDPSFIVVANVMNYTDFVQVWYYLCYQPFKKIMKFLTN